MPQENQPLKLSILIPSIPSRLTNFFIPLYSKLLKQVGDSPVEVLSFIDNKKRSIGLKRDCLMQSAKGDYVCFCDDDDNISDDYVEYILKAIDQNPDVDVIVFEQYTTINGANPFVVSFSIRNENQEAHYNTQGIWQNIERKPFHICVWKRQIAQKYRFPDTSYGEDWGWAEQALKDVKTEYKIPKILHYYKYDDNITEAEETPTEDENEIFPKQ